LLADRCRNLTGKVKAYFGVLADRVYKDGFIYRVTEIIFKLCYQLNLVEWLKRAGRRAAPQRNPELYTLAIIDAYAILKWAAVIFLWVFRERTRVSVAVAWYLLVSTLFTYIYYHLWDESAYSPLRLFAIRRRIINAIQAFAFSNLVYGYFYGIAYCGEFQGNNALLDVLAFSVANSLTVNYGGISPNTTAGRVLATSQLAVTFGLVATIIAKTLGSSRDETSETL